MARFGGILASFNAHGLLMISYEIEYDSISVLARWVVDPIV
jgi:hypothetical protein